MPNQIPLTDSQRKKGGELNPQDAGLVLDQAWSEEMTKLLDKAPHEECLLVLICLALLKSHGYQLSWLEFRKTVNQSNETLNAFLKTNGPTGNHDTRDSLIATLNTPTNLGNLKSIYPSADNPNSNRRAVTRSSTFFSKTVLLQQTLLDSSRELWGNDSKFEAHLKRDLDRETAGLVYRIRGAVATVKAHQETKLEKITVRHGKKRNDFLSDHFLNSLARASYVSLVGITHQSLVHYLDDALKRKREIEEDEAAIWHEINVVFLGERMLDKVDDELVASFGGNREDATAERRKIAAKAKHDLALWITAHSMQWRLSLYEYDFMLPFLGAIFSDDAGYHAVQIATLFPGEPTPDHLFIEFRGPSLAVDYYMSAFRKLTTNGRQLVYRCLVDNSPVPQENMP